LKPLHPAPALLCKHITGERALLDRKGKKRRGIA
jgi:hypothetical protein